MKKEIFSKRSFSIILAALGFCSFSFNNVEASEEKKSLCLKLHSIEQMYDEYDLSKWTLFTGGFINFGFWDIPMSNGEISQNQRLESEKNLYRVVLDKINVSSTDSVLEVACGLGYGTSLALSEFSPKEIKAIDFSRAQIERAKSLNSSYLKNKKVEFQQARAERIPYKNNQFEKVFSIEAVQHFSSVQDFLDESYRVLKPNGKLGIATFFATTKEAPQIASVMIKTAADNVDHLIPIENMKNMLENAGFVNIKIESIGKNVWEQFDKWIAQSEFKDTWNRNWNKAYQQKLIDYYIVTAEKANGNLKSAVAKAFHN